MVKITNCGMAGCGILENHKSKTRVLCRDVVDINRIDIAKLREENADVLGRRRVRDVGDKDGALDDLDTITLAICSAGSRDPIVVDELDRRGHETQIVWSAGRICLGG